MSRMNLLRVSISTRMVAVLCCLLLAVAVHAQQTSGSISGTVKDKQGAVVPGAKVTLINQVESGQREQTSSAEGNFTFVELVPSTYTVTVEATGFKKWEKKDLPLSSNSRLGVSDIELEVGSQTDSVTVEASAVQLQTESGEKTGTITGQMFQELSSRGRSFMDLLYTMPGVVGPNQFSANFNGQRDETNSFRVDGVVNVDSGVQQCCGSWVNVDLIQELKVTINGAPADMGRMSGAQINVVTKSGSKEFHGDLYFFKRAEWMNANSWTNKISNTPRGRDRNNIGGYTLGGPLFVPGKFNSNKNKLFFFTSMEMWRNTGFVTGNRLMPTALEKTGDFSKSVNSNGGAESVIDPLTHVQFPGNIVPANRQNADGFKLLNLLPNAEPASMLPSSAGYGYNYQYFGPPSYTDRLLQSYRLDYNFSDRWRVYARVLLDYQELGNPTPGSNFTYYSPGNPTPPSWAKDTTMGWYWQPRHGSTDVLDATTIINPTTTNEIILGFSRSIIPNYILNDTYTMANLGPTFQVQSLYPASASAGGNFAPVIQFSGSGIANQPQIGTNSYPNIADNNNFNAADNVVKVFTSHTVKAGIMFELDRKDQTSGTNFPGTFQFNNDINNNANETTDQYANLLMGNYETYNQQQKYIEGRYVYKDVEWYVEDTWKVRPNLTIDAGLRFYWVGPGYDAHGQMSTFNPGSWNPNTPIQLYQYACVPGSNCSGTNAKALDPVSGLLYPSSLRGLIIPESYPNMNNGYVAGRDGGKYLIQDPGITYGPRIGVAWQPAMLPKTVIRFGSGIFYDRYFGNVVYGGTNSPPVVRNPTLYFGNIDAVNSGYVTWSPGGGNGWTGTGKLPTTVNYNFSIQHELPFAIMAEAGYVGGITRHLMYQLQVNEPGWGAAWLPWTQNYTVTPKYDGTTTLPTNFWRPYIGIGGNNTYTNGASSNYNSLQMKAEKRMTRKLSFTLAYTWSKAMGVTDNSYNAVNPFNTHLYNYGRRSYDRTQIFNFSYVYFLPKFGKNHNLLDIPVVRLAINDWQLSGLATASTGSPFSYSCCSFLNDGSNISQRWTGNPDYGPRSIILPNLHTVAAGMDPTYAAFNTAAIVVPPGGPATPSVGLESGFSQFSNPTVFFSNIQTTMMKNIMFSKDNNRRYLQLRLETYNTFNCHEYNGINSSAQWMSPAQPTILTNLPAGISTITQNGGRFGFGALTGTNATRTMQAAVKIYF